MSLCLSMIAEMNLSDIGIDLTAPDEYGALYQQGLSVLPASPVSCISVLFLQGRITLHSLVGVWCDERRLNDM